MTPILRGATLRRQHHLEPDLWEPYAGGQAWRVNRGVTNSAGRSEHDDPGRHRCRAACGAGRHRCRPGSSCSDRISRSTPPAAGWPGTRPDGTPRTGSSRSPPGAGPTAVRYSVEDGPLDAAIDRLLDEERKASDVHVFPFGGERVG